MYILQTGFYHLIVVRRMQIVSFMYYFYVSLLPGRESRIENPSYIFEKWINEFFKLSQVLRSFTLLPLHNFFIFPYSFLSFIHLLFSIALAWVSFYIRGINTLYVSKFYEQENPWDQRAWHEHHVGASIDYAIIFPTFWEGESERHFFKNQLGSKLETLHKNLPSAIHHKQTTFPKCMSQSQDAEMLLIIRDSNLEDPFYWKNPKPKIP